MLVLPTTSGREGGSPVLARRALLKKLRSELDTGWCRRRSVQERTIELALEGLRRCKAEVANGWQGKGDGLEGGGIILKAFGPLDGACVDSCCKD